MILIPKQTFFNLPEEKQERIFKASVKEFSDRRFQDAKLSNIIKDAKIPRGSFYQYFDDKMDLYKYVFTKIGEHKISYMTEDLKNPQKLAFFDLFRELYKVGIKFAADNPEYVKITSLLMAHRDFVYQEVFGDNINVAIDFYKMMIVRDQEEGRMDKKIDPDTLADLVINMTMNVTLGSISTENSEIDFAVYEKKIENVIYIFEKGIRGT